MQASKGLWFGIVQNHPRGFHFYADDTQLYVHLTHKNVGHASHRLKSYLDDVKKWSPTNKLKLIPHKTEFVIFGSKLRENSTLFRLIFLGILPLL